MKFFIPQFALGKEQPKQTALLPKLGGYPWGFPVECWPNCLECGLPMHHFAQLPHIDGVLDLNDPNRVVHIFKCDYQSICTDFSLAARTNAVVALDQCDLQDGLTEIPWDNLTAHNRENEQPHLCELLISSWAEHDDGLDASLEPSFYNVGAFFELPDAVASPSEYSSLQQTKAGGLPYWTGNGPLETDYPSERVIFQIDQILHLSETPRTPMRGSLHDGGDLMDPQQVHFNYGAGTIAIEIANFYSDGTGFLLMKRKGDDITFGFEIMR